MRDYRSATPLSIVTLMSICNHKCTLLSSPPYICRPALQYLDTKANLKHILKRSV